MYSQKINAFNRPKNEVVKELSKRKAIFTSIFYHGNIAMTKYLLVNARFSNKYLWQQVQKMAHTFRSSVRVFFFLLKV